jgi:hypothetical protein
MNFRFGWLRQTNPEKLTLPLDDDDDVRLHLAIDDIAAKAFSDRRRGLAYT